MTSMPPVLTPSPSPESKGPDRFLDPTRLRTRIPSIPSGRLESRILHPVLTFRSAMSYLIVSRLLNFGCGTVLETSLG